MRVTIVPLAQQVRSSCHARRDISVRLARETHSHAGMGRMLQLRNSKRRRNVLYVTQGSIVMAADFLQSVGNVTQVCYIV